MAQPYSRGPVDIFVGVGSAHTPTFLGHATKGPRIRVRRFYRDVFNDLGGDMVPFDRARGSQMGVVSVVLTRWNEAVLQAAQDTAGGVGTPGTEDPGEVGALMLTEGVAQPLWLRFPKAAHAAYAGTMPAGFHFPAAMLDQEDDLDDNGPWAARVALTWTCLRTLDMTVSNAMGVGRFTLYDFTLAGLGPIN